LSVDWIRNNGDDAKVWFQNASTYEWEVGAANATDVINIAETGSQDNYLQVDATTTLKVVDSGGTPGVLSELTVFTYDLGVTTPDTATLNANVSIDISGTGYTGSPSLVNDGAGRIYLTGLSGGGGGPSPFDSWATSGSLGPVTFGGDTNGDGVCDGLAFLLGAANPDDNALGLLPTPTENGSGGLVMTFTMLDSASRGTAALSVEHSGDLGVTDPWAAALVPDATGTVSGVDFAVSGSGTLSVIATIPETGNAIGGKLFGRLTGTE
jgi:hypothetical protein